MNPYLHKLDRIEFVVTYRCTGACKHCSEGDCRRDGTVMDPERAEQAILAAAARYPIRTLMTFGGEPLLCPDVVCRIHDTARKAGIPRRQVITNGYFSRDPARIRQMAEALAEAGVNDLLLSVDAFHQETIPMEPVKDFARALLAWGVPVRLQPAWLVSREDENIWNSTTRQVLREFTALGIPEHDGNVIFPSGNARIWLKDYFDLSAPVQDPYAEDPACPRTLSFSPNGDVLNGNCIRTPMEEILEQYHP